MTPQPSKSGTLSSGHSMPLIGLETSFSTTDSPPDPTIVENTVKTALQLGYRHIDCAPIYQNEVAVGKGIKASGVPREELFVTSKLWNTEHDPKDVGPALEKSLRDLGLEYVDLYLIHWPQTYVPLTSTWRAMEDRVKAGKARSIGVSNFTLPLLEELLSFAEIPPAVLQILTNPYYRKKDRLEWCHSKNIHITAWGPLTIERNPTRTAASDPAAQKIAAQVGITPAQLILSWAV